MTFTQDQLRDLLEAHESNPHSSGSPESNARALEIASRCIKLNLAAPALARQLLSALVRIEELEAKVAEGKALLTEALAEITSQEFADRIKAASEFGQAITKN